MMIGVIMYVIHILISPDAIFFLFTLDQISHEPYFFMDLKRLE